MNGFREALQQAIDEFAARASARELQLLQELDQAHLGVAIGGSAHLVQTFREELEEAETEATAFEQAAHNWEFEAESFEARAEESAEASAEATAACDWS